MHESILVAYASRAGATQGVAEAIGRALRESGVPVEVRPVAEITEVSPYRAVIAGSAIQGGAWLPEALHFVEANRADLCQRPFASFLVCMTLAMRNGEQYRGQVAAWLAPVRALVRPVSEGLFAGALDLRQVPSFGDRLKFRMSIAMGVWSEGDHRDWQAIHGWAEGLRPLLAA